MWIFYVKNHSNLSDYFSIEEYLFWTTFFVKTFFYNFNFWTIFEPLPWGRLLIEMGNFCPIMSLCARLYYKFWNIYKYEPCGWGFMQAKQHPYIIHAIMIRKIKQATIIPVIWLLLKPVACGKSSEFWLAVIAPSAHFCSLHLQRNHKLNSNLLQI